MEKNNQWNKDLHFVLQYYKEGLFDTKCAIDEFHRRTNVCKCISYQWIGIVATVLSVFGLWVLYQKPWKEDVVQFSSTDSAKTLILEDGSQITLAPHSTISYNEKRFKKFRNVRLFGKAFFDIHHNTLHPFTVDCGPGRIQDIGTSFEAVTNNGRTTEVLVTDGEIRLSERSEGKSIIITEGEKGNIVKGHLLKETGANINDAAWATGVFIFNNTPVRKALRDISKCYGVSLSANDESKSITGEFKVDSLEQAIEILEKTLDIKIVKVKGEQK
ncbi:MAG: FecR domain-containing protein [Prevotella sp.]|uniref:FecR family protein n=1 Tax=Prevotella sp. TaxID=59823 RepID=UPI002589FFA7|nr:FecR domain-containing protein [Prevotella sp.]MDD6854101.1 FecR domain-containing protein [Prevotella sp.]